MFTLSATGQFSYETLGNTVGIPAVSNGTCALADSCFTLTPDLANQSGGVWDSKPINLNYSFDVTFCIKLGSNNQWGADGAAFVMRGKNSATFGNIGAGLGYEGISPSLAIEFDTWENSTDAVDDIPSDHTGLYFNSDYTTPAVPAISLLPFGINVEDGFFHNARISWNASTQTLRMYFDGFLRIEKQSDLINEVFSGENTVYWGFTASTGGVSNLQQVCFPKYALTLDDREVCANDSVALSFYDPLMTSYLWTNPKGDTLKYWNTLDFSAPFDLSDSLFYVSDSGMYTLEIAINNQVVSDSLLLTVHPLPLPAFDQDMLVLCPDTLDLKLSAQNDNCSYLWSTGETSQEIFALEAQWYTVELTDTLYACKSKDSIQISHECADPFRIPDVFTPNGDAQNDIYELIFSSSIKWLAEFNFEIYNRWGQQVYAVQNEYVHWDGTIAGKEAKSGVYFYRYSYREKKATASFKGQGFIQLIR